MMPDTWSVHSHYMSPEVSTGHLRLGYVIGISQASWSDGRTPRVVIAVSRSRCKGKCSQKRPEYHHTQCKPHTFTHHMIGVQTSIVIKEMADKMATGAADNQYWSNVGYSAPHCHYREASRIETVCVVKYRDGSFKMKKTAFTIL